jgi:hypothetical protein
MPRLRAFLLAPALGALVASCSEDARPVVAHEFVEWVQVDGTCQEDHATQAGHYNGDLVHWRNKVTGASDRYGSVSNWDSASVEAMADLIKHPSKYHPPFSVEFSDISATDFQSQTFVLHGISDDTEHNAHYETTCNLSVQRRLNHLPSNKERQEWLAAPAAGGATKP